MNLDNTLRKRIMRSEDSHSIDRAWPTKMPGLKSEVVMKALLLTLVLVLSSTYVIAQKTPAWYRVYTFDESIIEMNTSNVIVGGDIGRVTFRWTFDQPEVLNGNPKLTYKTRLETIDFRCTDWHYRYSKVTLLG